MNSDEEIIFPACKEGEHAECIGKTDLLYAPDRRLVKCQCDCHKN